MSGPRVEQEVTTIPERGATYVDCRIDGVDGERADLRSATFESCTFTHCTLRLADLTDARLSDCTFASCDLMGIDLTHARWPQFDLGEPLRFVACRMDYANLHGLRLDGAVLYDCSLVEADLQEASLPGADLRFADLTGARLNGADLSRANLSGAIGYAMHPDHTRLTGATVSMPEAAALLRALGMVIAPAEARLSAAERLRGD